MSWVKKFLDRLITLQTQVLNDIPEEKRKEGYGRAAKMVVDGPEGGIFDLWFTETGIQEKPDEVPVKNVIYLSEDTLLNLITPDVDLDTLVGLVDKAGVERAVPQLYPRLDFRTAIANRLITMSGDKSDVDSEEWAQIMERVLLKMAFPIVIRAMVKKTGKEKGNA